MNDVTNVHHSGKLVTDSEVFTFQQWEKEYDNFSLVTEAHMRRRAPLSHYTIGSNKPAEVT